MSTNNSGYLLCKHMLSFYQFNCLGFPSKNAENNYSSVLSTKCTILEPPSENSFQGSREEGMTVKTYFKICRETMNFDSTILFWQVTELHDAKMHKVEQKETPSFT